jgi:hypothetical protein
MPETFAQEQEHRIYSGQHMPERQISNAKEWSTELEQAGNIICQITRHRMSRTTYEYNPDTLICTAASCTEPAESSTATCSAYDQHYQCTASASNIVQLGAQTKELASRLPVWVLVQASLHFRFCKSREKKYSSTQVHQINYREPSLKISLCFRKSSLGPN